jgi:hypothetical protein
MDPNGVKAKKRKKHALTCLYICGMAIRRQLMAQRQNRRDVKVYFFAGMASGK